jgi:hypothetical protein
MGESIYTDSKDGSPLVGNRTAVQNLVANVRKVDRWLALFRTTFASLMSGNFRGKNVSPEPMIPRTFNTLH